MAKGSVKWFNTAKGYGFIVSEDNPDDLFAHFSAIIMKGYKTLVDGEAVAMTPRPQHYPRSPLNLI